ncbi:MAG: TetR/AcrR family transcriptional regulator [Hyphomicrobiaceae bacterium]|nr:TetR/AcrR family transcriptional regulator [Hyphomicrobiaceae bacterium]
MFDETTPHGRIAAAALAIAAERPWSDVSLRDIATRAGFSLVEMRQHVASKGDVLAAIVRGFDDEVLAHAPATEAGEPRRDAVFEVMMARFDAMQPHKAALKSIVATSPPDPTLMRAMLASQAWMLQAAGIDSGGIGGGVRVLGLATVYASVFRTWLEDDDPGMARTMAALDRRLRRGERSLSRLDDIGDVLGKAGGFFSNVLSGRRTASGEASQPAAPRSGTAPDSTG